MPFFVQDPYVPPLIEQPGSHGLLKRRDLLTHRRPAQPKRLTSALPAAFMRDRHQCEQLLHRMLPPRRMS